MRHHEHHTNPSGTELLPVSGQNLHKNEGLAMGAPTPSMLSVYLQGMENTTIYDLLIKHQVEGYLRYGDDILVLYREDKINIHEMLEDFNNIGPHYEVHSRKRTK
jgi:hypothetical protein